MSIEASRRVINRHLTTVWETEEDTVDPAIVAAINGGVRYKDLDAFLKKYEPGSNSVDTFREFFETGGVVMLDELDGPTEEERLGG